MSELTIHTFKSTLISILPLFDKYLFLKTHLLDAYHILQMFTSWKISQKRKTKSEKISKEGQQPKPTS